MRVSAKAEYACAAMLELALSFNKPGPVPIREIAEAHHISGRFLVQILLQLKTAGLVTSVRGAEGGYRLARSPEQITLGAIINAIDDRTTPPRAALAEAHRTPIVSVLLGVWEEIQRQEQRYLERLTLADLLRRTQENDALVYQI